MQTKAIMEVILLMPRAHAGWRILIQVKELMGDRFARLVDHLRSTLTGSERALKSLERYVALTLMV